MKDSNRAASWKNIASLIIDNRRKLRELLTDDDLRIRIQFFCVYIIFSIVSMFMTVVNIATEWKSLMLSTLIFSIANLINILLSLVSKRGEYLARVLFAIEILALFAFFTISGNPEGFSAIWIALLPACGLLLYRLTYGIVLSLAQFLILIFLFWTEPGKALLQYEYTVSFLLRFPFLYIAFFAVGCFFEFIRSSTQKELVTTREQYMYLSKHDILTGLYNRSGFNAGMSETLREDHAEGYALAILDLDNFKTINDTYGHSHGDTVLAGVANTLAETVGESGKVSRWGGEEFAILFMREEGAEETCLRILELVRSLSFFALGETYHVTVSIGLLRFHSAKDIDTSTLVTLADANMYTAKQNGKDRLVVSTLN